jgi:hypothetical protein
MNRALFGGALSITLEERFSDCSLFRPIPDTQEVFSDPETDQSVIVEVLELGAESTGQHAGLFHFEALRRDNNASATEVQLVVPPEDLSVTFNDTSLAA